MSRLSRIVAVLICASISLSVDSAQSLQLKGIEAFDRGQARSLIDRSRSVSDLVSALQSACFSEAFFGASIAVSLSSDTVVTVTAGYRYTLRDIKPVGVSDSLWQQSQSRIDMDLPAKRANLTGLLEAIARTRADEGYPYIVVSADSLILRGSVPSLFVSVNLGPQVAVAGLSFAGLRTTKTTTLDPYLEVRAGEIYSESRVQASENNLRKLEFAQISRPTEVIFRPDDKDVSVVFHLKEERNFLFDGLGYLTPDNQLAGSIDGRLRNIFGYGESVSFEWQRANKTSSSLKLSSSIPRILGTPLDASLALSQNDRDSSFVNTQVRAELLYHLSSAWSFSAGTGWSKITPEVEQLTNPARILDVELRTTHDSRDRIKSTRRGILLEYSFLSAYRREFPAGGGVRSGYSRRLSGSLALYRPVARDLVIKQRLRAFQSASDFEPLPLDELIEVGGPRSVRGYRDNSFFAKVGGISNTELLWYALDNLTLSLFSDNGVIETAQGNVTLTGFGAGMRIDTSLGEFRFEAAVGEEKALDKLLVHFGFAGGI